MPSKWTRGQILHEIARTGTLNLPSGIRPRQRARLGQKVGVPGRGHLAQPFYATSPEVAWLMVTMVCEQGYNPSVLDTMEATTCRADDHVDDPAVHVADLDEPRRGPHGRYFSNVFSGRRANLLELAIAITQPARDILALLGQPTDKLLVARVLGGTSLHATGAFKTDWSVSGNGYAAVREGPTVLGDDGSLLKVTFQALRLTGQVVNRRARQNSDAVSEGVYRQAEPQTRQHAVGVITQGQTDAIEHAHTTVKMRAASWPSTSASAPSEMVARELEVPQETAATFCPASSTPRPPRAWTSPTAPSRPNQASRAQHRSSPASPASTQSPHPTTCRDSLPCMTRFDASHRRSIRRCGKPTTRSTSTISTTC